MDSPYRAPKAIVADSPAPARTPPPKQVSRGTAILWAALALSLSVFFPAVEPDLWSGMEEYPWMIAVLAVMILLMFGLQAWLISTCYRGSHWARTGLVCMTLMSIGYLVRDFVSPENSTSLSLTLSTATTLLECGGLGLLFTPGSRNWFLKPTS